MTGRATVPGVANERYFFGHDLTPLQSEVTAAQERARKARGLPPGASLPPMALLAVSGGGENGAFGAGLLCGWTVQGTRPEFTLVAGMTSCARSTPRSSPPT